MHSNNTFTCEDFAFTDWELEDVHDERLEVETLFTSRIGIAITITSALISTFASLLIIRVIVKSVKGLMGSVYHRILFGMSIFDIVQSLAIALATLPMPTDMFYQQFQGLVLGNKTTCQIQGALVALGSMTGLAYNAMLSIYYVCSIRHDMPDQEFSKRFEWWLHVASITIGTSISVLVLISESVHPSPTRSNWCGVNGYPWYCSGFGTRKHIAQIRFGMTVFTGIVSVACLAVFLICMLLIVCRVHNKDKKNQPNYTEEEEDLHEILDNSRSVQEQMQARICREKKLVSRQALAYTVVNLFNYFMIVVFPMGRILTGSPIPQVGWQALFLIMRPLQGLFNCIIFIYHRVDSIKRSDPTLGYLPALYKVLRGEESPHRVVSDLVLVRRHSALARLNFAGVSLVEEEDDEEDDGVEEITPSSSSDIKIAPLLSIVEKSREDSHMKVVAEKPNEESADQNLVILTPKNSVAGGSGEASQDLSGYLSHFPDDYAESCSFSLDSQAK